MNAILMRQNHSSANHTLLEGEVYNVGDEGLSPRFASYLLGMGYAEAVEVGETLADRTVAELRDIAGSLGLDVPKRVNKDDLIAAIETAEAGFVPEASEDV